jgi:hypothetical protein
MPLVRHHDLKVTLGYSHALAKARFDVHGSTRATTFGLTPVGSA